MRRSICAAAIAHISAKAGRFRHRSPARREQETPAERLARLTDLLDPHGRIHENMRLDNKPLAVRFPADRSPDCWFPDEARA
jgi:hypothetical protein